MKLRHEVFVMEQKLVEEEYDELDRDETTEHWWFSDDAGLCSYLRVVRSSEPPKIGRVVTRPDRRGQGLAGRLLREVLARHPVTLALSAQAQLEGWYATFGFTRQGPNYIESGIPHCLMIRTSTSA